MSPRIAIAILHGVVLPLANISRVAGRFDACLGDVWADVFFTRRNENESTDPTWLRRSLRRVVKAAQLGSESRCPANDGAHR